MFPSRLVRAALAVPFALPLVIGLGAMATSPLPAQESTSNSGGDHWGANYFPNIELTTQDGDKVRFFDDCIKGKVVLLSFIYTSCPDACPLETARVAEVQGILGDRVGKDVFFYSITIDPEHDTPQVLKEYAERYQAGPGWLFLTGKKDEIANLRLKLGMFDPDYDQKLSDHSLNLMIGNQKTGRWQKSGPYENPYVLATQLGEWLHNWTRPRAEKRDYANAPELRQISKGESTFRMRCASCHAVGGTNTKLAKLGPNLFGVADRRDPQWLQRWLLEPDKMLAEKDPIAMPMFEAYNKVAMPNMRLSETEAQEILDYLKEETARVAAAPPPGSTEDGKDAEAPHSCCAKKDHLVVDDGKVPTEDKVPSDDKAAAAASTAPTPTSAPEREMLSTGSKASIGAGILLALLTALVHLRARGRAA